MAVGWVDAIDREVRDRACVDACRAGRHHAVDVADRDAEQCPSIYDRATIGYDGHTGRAGIDDVEGERHSGDWPVDFRTWDVDAFAQFRRDLLPSDPASAQRRKDPGEGQSQPADQFV